MDATLQIPDGIRFQCSGCANCCLQWPVPVTSEDVARIETLAPSEVAAATGPGDLDRAFYSFLRRYQSGAGGFRPLSVGDRRFSGFSHTLEKRADGKCQFLTDDNRCILHVKFGEESKPSMCQLFPYAFSKTPDGVFAYVSFASSAALFNHGQLLSEQSEMLQQKYELYERLFPQNNPDWSQLQILDGHSLSWRAFSHFDSELIQVVSQHNDCDALSLLARCSRLIVSELPARADAERLPPMPASPSTVDRVILKHMASTYLPTDVFTEDNFDMDVKALMNELVHTPPAVSYAGVEMDEIANQKLGRLDEQSEDLLRRFVYCRLFAKLYLGPNLAHLSLLAGTHHLYFIIALVRLHLKAARAQGKSTDFETTAETLRTIERRLTQMNFSVQTSAVMEVLFSSPSRLPRVAELVA